MSDQRSESPVDTSLLAGEIRVVLGQLVRRLREQAEGSDLTKSQSSVLLRLERDGAATATALARAEGVRPQSMAKIIQVLQDAGLVTGSPDPNDGRKTLLSLTEAAREQFRTGRRAKEDWLARALEAGFSAAEIRQLSACTDLLRRLGQFP
ncbi:MarR family winged helix-turn-helix transcriptional regulator [Saccharopolyspora phatthalungensis]|uniref:DNA-binding MarR family transcriptional regulator n=1 Tax=Saccharopolyspora phatthalungensis TaxID=664693 RepID=A0A840QFS9_9PSEU|nr:MarR family winged helix-turn-helix transcriptional regulator [Saccharopolyspora phatthalungensis]MBB5159694.1 DNA-binding MarR family transcriptional regulator [Saccharopolyspora phatthalungensis]